MKKALIIFLSMVLIFALAACGEKGEEGSQVQGSASTEASNTPSEETEKGKTGLSLDDIAGTYSMNTYYDGKEQKHTVVFTKSGDKLVASSDAKGEEPFELSYDPASGTASYVQKIPHEDSEITIDSKYTFILEDGGTKVNGETTMLFKDETKDGPRYEGYKID
jgi:glucose/arabinose dehydrogenase